jgi:hypothetical protein
MTEQRPHTVANSTATSTCHWQHPRLPQYACVLLARRALLQTTSAAQAHQARHRATSIVVWAAS